MKTKKMNIANIIGKLNRAEMKNILAGVGCEDEDQEEGVAPICTSCNSDADCPAFKVCRSSPSCIYQSKVCAKPIYC